MTLRQIIGISSAAAVLLGTTAFADSKSEIVGKWAEEGDVPHSIEFKADGTFVEKVGDDVMKGKYSLPDATHIKEEMEGPLSAMGPVMSAIVVKGDSLEVTPEGAPATKYKRETASK